MSRLAPQPHLPEDLARAEADVERARQRVASSVAALREEWVRRSGCRRGLSEHTLAIVGGALALGYWLGCRRR